METIKILLMPVLYFAFLFYMMVLVFVSAWPLVLGSELNADGTVEYLCLGRGCEDL